MTLASSLQLLAGHITCLLPHIINLLQAATGSKVQGRSSKHINSSQAVLGGTQACGSDNLQRSIGMRHQQLELEQVHLHHNTSSHIKVSSLCGLSRADQHITTCSLKWLAMVLQPVLHRVLQQAEQRQL